MKATFEAALAAVLASEGGFVNNRHDPGGATNQGVTQKVYDAWRKTQNLALRSVRFITPDEVAAIYRQQYWDMVRGDDLPAGIDYVVFDYAVNSGVERAACELQRALGVRPDGVLGVVTLQAAAKFSAFALITKICDGRLVFLCRLKHWRYFGKGWRKRVEHVRRNARMIALGATPNSAMPKPTSVLALSQSSKLARA